MNEWARSIGAMILTREKSITWRKTCPVHHKSYWTGLGFVIDECHWVSFAPSTSFLPCRYHSTTLSSLKRPYLFWDSPSLFFNGAGSSGLNLSADHLRMRGDNPPLPLHFMERSLINCRVYFAAFGMGGRWFDLWELHWCLSFSTIRLVQL